MSSSRRAPADDDAPNSITQLADMSEEGLNKVWDRTLPINQYILAIRQLHQETKIYQREGDWDPAFCQCVKIHMLTTDYLPNRHPQYHTLSPAVRGQLAKEADFVAAQMSDLKRIIYDRSQDWERSHPAGGRPSSVPPRLPSSSFQPALAPKNTVQPGTYSMSSTPSPTSNETELLEKLATAKAKLGPRAKLRRLVGKGKGREREVVGPRLVEPGTKIDEGVEPEEKDDWNLVRREEEGPTVVPSRPGGVGQGQGLPRQTPLIRPEDAWDWPGQGQGQGQGQGNWEQPALGRGPAGVRKSASSASNKMPMPGEDDEEEEDGVGIAYTPSPGYGPQWVNGRPPSYHSAPPSIYSGHHPSAPPQWGAPPADIYAALQNTLQPHYAPPPTTQQSWPPYGPPPVQSHGAQLQRSMSRLTTSHQQQQGYSPSQLLPAVFPPPSNPYPQPPPTYLPPPPDPSSRPPSLSYSNIPPPHPSLAVAVPAQLYAAIPPPQSRYPSLPPPQSSYPAPQPSPATSPSRTSQIRLPPPLPPSAPAQSPPAPSAPLQPAYPRPLPQTQPHAHSSHYHAPPPIFASEHPQASAPPAGGMLVRSASMAALPLGLLSKRGSGRSSNKGLDGLGALGEALEMEEEPLTLTEGGQPLRTVVLPADLMGYFTSIAYENTERGIETCGLLMGTLSHNTFTITNLLVPKQEGTADTCTTTHEEEQFAYQDDRDLMTLGWIHTHPTQTCFMSSLDLHTHASYQVMLAEAIAIVCAPKHEPGYGIFRLTDPPGLETIVECSLPGLFHPHPDLPIYTDTDHGHVQIRARAKFECHDLRRK